MNLERLDAFDINFVDSAARSELKLKTSTGVGECRIYIGKDKETLDDFFDFENVEYCITKKSDLIKYMDDAYKEYMFPTQQYKNDISVMYEKFKSDTENIPDEVLKYSFRKKFDNQNRYYLVLENGTNNKNNYSYIRNIVLPRITKYCFIKFKDKSTGKIFIYMKPILFNNLKVKEDVLDEDKNDMNESKKQTRRLKQSEYRRKLLEDMPFCPFTKVTDDRILVACHIKPFSECKSDEERYDSKNGITMTPTYHTLFDLGFISFENNGLLLVSPFLSNITKQRLNLKDGDRLRLQTGSDKYLQYHRENIFAKCLL